VSIFFPYGRLSKLNSMLETYEEIYIGDEYSKCIRSFASVIAGEQIVSSGSENMLVLETLLGGLSGGTQTAPTTEFSSANAVGLLLNAFLSGGDYSSITGLVGDALGWLDADLMKSSIEYYEDNRFDASALTITEKSGQRVLALSDKVGSYSIYGAKCFRR
jgi:hypothetical protein